MINFNDELEKFEPLLEVDDVEKSIRTSDEVQDILEMLNHISARIKFTGKE